LYATAVKTAGQSLVQGLQALGVAIAEGEEYLPQEE
jgi:hypothetical protein